MLSIQIQTQTQNFTIIKTKNKINNLPSKIGMDICMNTNLLETKRRQKMKFAQERIGIEGFYNLKALQALDVLKFDNLVLVFASMIGL